MPKVSEEYFEAKKLEIIDAAYRVALRKSISSMTLMDVREEAGMARGAIYRYYNSLDDVLISLIEKINRNNSYLEEVQKIFSRQDSLSPDKLLKRVCDFLYSYLTSREMDIHSLSLQFDIFCIHEPERVKEMLAKAEIPNNNFSYLMQNMYEYIKDQTKSGKLHPVMPAKKLIDYFFTIYKGIQLQYTLEEKMGTDSYDAKTTINAMYKTMLALLGIDIG